MRDRLQDGSRAGKYWEYLVSFPKKRRNNKKKAAPVFALLSPEGPVKVRRVPSESRRWWNRQPASRYLSVGRFYLQKASLIIYTFCGRDAAPHVREGRWLIWCRGANVLPPLCLFLNDGQQEKEDVSPRLVLWRRPAVAVGGLPLKRKKIPNKRDYAFFLTWTVLHSKVRLN